MCQLLGNLFVTKDKQKQDGSIQKEITPADRVRIAHETREQNDSGHEEEAEAALRAFAEQTYRRGDTEGKGEQGVKSLSDASAPIEITPADRDKFCEHCGRFLEPSSRILGIEHYCPTCDGPFSRRVLIRWLVAAFWGAAVALGFVLMDYFRSGDIKLSWIVFLFIWPVVTLLQAINKILPELHGGGYGGGDGGG